VPLTSATATPSLLSTGHCPTANPDLPSEPQIAAVYRTRTQTAAETEAVETLVRSCRPPPAEPGALPPRRSPSGPTGDPVHLPEQLFARNCLVLRHRPSGLRLSFTAAGALAAWARGDWDCAVATAGGAGGAGAPVEVPVADDWRATRAKRLAAGKDVETRAAAGAGNGNVCGDGNEDIWQVGLAQVRRLVYDWTFCTPYGGDVATAQTASNATAPDGDATWAALSSTGVRSPSVAARGSTFSDGVAPLAQQSPLIDRALLTARDPILWSRSITLMGSDLDDTGVHETSVKVRVMPRCFLVLLRTFVRVDGVRADLRETRWFARWDRVQGREGGGVGGSGGTLVREVRWAGGTADELVEAGALGRQQIRAGVRDDTANRAAARAAARLAGGVMCPFADGDAAAASLMAVAPRLVRRYETGWVELGERCAG